MTQGNVPGAGKTGLGPLRVGGRIHAVVSADAHVMLARAQCELGAVVQCDVVLRVNCGILLAGFDIRQRAGQGLERACPPGTVVPVIRVQADHQAVGHAAGLERDAQAGCEGPDPHAGVHIRIECANGVVSHPCRAGAVAIGQVHGQFCETEIEEPFETAAMAILCRVVPGAYRAARIGQQLCRGALTGQAQALVVESELECDMSGGMKGAEFTVHVALLDTIVEAVVVG